MTQPKTDLAYLRNEKAKAEQKLRSCQHREKILERQMSELNRRERVHRLCTRAGMLESFLVCPGELTDDQVMELLKIWHKCAACIQRMQYTKGLGLSQQAFCNAKMAFVYTNALLATSFSSSCLEDRKYRLPHRIVPIPSDHVKPIK